MTNTSKTRRKIYNATQTRNKGEKILIMKNIEINACVVFILLVILVLGAIIACVFEVRQKQSYGCSMVLLTIGLIITATYGFYVTSETTRLQTSMDFCLSTYKMFQSKEFIEREKFVCEGLRQRGENYCAIEEIDNDTLREAVYEYCEIMNGVGVLVLEYMVNTDVVVSYLGANTLTTFLLIEPYLNLTREARYNNVPKELPEYERELIQQAQPLTFAHFELLAVEIRGQAPELIDKFKKQLQLHNKNKKNNQKK